MKENASNWQEKESWKNKVLIKFPRIFLYHLRWYFFFFFLQCYFFFFLLVILFFAWFLIFIFFPIFSFLLLLFIYLFIFVVFIAFPERIVGKYFYSVCHDLLTPDRAMPTHPSFSRFFFLHSILSAFQLFNLVLFKIVVFLRRRQRLQLLWLFLQLRLRMKRWWRWW